MRLSHRDITAATTDIYHNESEDPHTGNPKVETAPKEVRKKLFELDPKRVKEDVDISMGLNARNQMGNTPSTTI